MATKNTNITFGNTSTHVSNKDAAHKVFDISANAKIVEDRFAGLEGGSFSNAKGTGWFQLDENNNFGFGCSGLDAEDFTEALTSIVTFYNEVKQAINSKMAE